MVSFDVSSDAGRERDDGLPGASQPPPGWWSRAGERWQRADSQQRLLYAGAAGAIALVVAGGTAVGAAVAAQA